MKNITKTQLFDLLAGLNGATIVTLTTMTEVKMNKKGNPLAGNKVEKLSTINCQFGYNYENAVNNRLDKAGVDNEFKAASLPWGEWAVANKIIFHNGEFYGRFYVLKNGKTESIYFVDGEIATAEQVEIIKAFTPSRGESTKQAENGLTENQVKPMAFKFSAIRVIKVGGEEYRITENVAVPATA